MSFMCAGKKTIFTLFTALLLLALSACNKEQQAEQLEMQRYAVPDQGLEIFYPAAWSQRYDERQVIFYPSAELNNPLSPKVALEVVAGAKGFEETKRDLKQIVEEGLSKIPKTSAPKVLLRERTTILGQEAEDLVVSLKIGETAFKEELLYIPHQGNFIALYYLAPKDKFEEYLPIFHNMLLKLSLSE